MPPILMMLAVASAQPVAPSPAPGAQPALARRTMLRSGEYLAYRQCLQRTAGGAYDAGIIPEDLLPQLVAACSTERDALVKSANFRANMRPDADAHDEDALVSNLTSPFVAVAIRNYMFRYATGRRLGQ